MSKKTIPPLNDETQSQAVARYLNDVAKQSEAVRTFICVWHYEREVDDDFTFIALTELSEYVCRRMMVAANALENSVDC